MKLLYKVMAAAAGILALSSCVDDAVAPLTGMYEKPVEYVMTELTNQSVVKGEGSRTFTVELAGSNASLSMKFVGSKYLLEGAAYTPAPADVAKAGNYIVGNGGSTFTLGGNVQNIESGTLTVTEAEGKYTFSGNLWLADETVVKVNASAAIVYEADPEPVIMKNVLSASSNLMSGVKTVTLSLAQDGLSSTMDPTTYQTIWTGEGNYMSMDIYSADGFLHEGTYTACAVGGTVNEGEFGIGYDTVMDFGFGPMEMKDWGTCWWTVKNGAATAQKVLSGTVTVTKKGAGWEIELKSGEGKNMIWGKFTGEIPALTPTDPNAGEGGGASNYVALSQFVSITDYSAWGAGNFAGVELADANLTVTPGMMGNTYAGTGNYLKLELYCVGGQLAAGTYAACAAGGVIGEGEFGIGYDGDWGPSGTTWYTVTDGTATPEYITDGTVTVEVDGDNYTITLESTVVNAQYTGKLSN